MITNLNFLKVAKQKKKTFISTGMCSMQDISRAVKIFKKINVILHYYIVFPYIHVLKKN